MRHAHLALLLLLAVPNLGCPALFNALINGFVYEQGARASAVKNVLGGSAERAMLGNIVDYFSGSDLGEPVALDLATGERTPTGIALYPNGQEYNFPRVRLRTDGDYAVWSETTPYDELAGTIHILDLRTGEQRDLWEDQRFEDLVVGKWLLAGGRIIAGARTAAPDGTADPYGPIISNLIHDIATQETRRVPPAFLPKDEMLSGTTGFVISQSERSEPVESGGARRIYPVDSSIVATDLESGQSRTLITLPAVGWALHTFATPSHIVWDEADSAAERFVVTYYALGSGEVGTFELPFSFTETSFVDSAGDAGFVVSSTESTNRGSAKIILRFVDYAGQVRILQRYSYTLLGAWPIQGRTAVLGDRVIWNDLIDGTLRYTLISTGETGAYD